MLEIVLDDRKIESRSRRRLMTVILGDCCLHLAGGNGNIELRNHSFQRGMYWKLRSCKIDLHYGRLQMLIVNIGRQCALS